MADKNLYERRGLRWRDVRTGLLGVAGLAVMAWLALVIGDNNGMFAKVATLTFFATDVKGLVEGNQVTISGKKIGTVELMDITTKDDTVGVRVTLRVREEYLTVLTVDTRAVIKSLGVLGDKYVDLVRGKGQPLPDGGEIVMVAEPGIEDLTTAGLSTLERVNRLGDELTSIAGRINRGEGTVGRLITTNELGDRIDLVARRADQAILSLKTTMDRTRDGNGLLPRLLNDPAMANRVNGTIAQLEDLVGQLRAGRGTIGRLLTSDSLYMTIADVTKRIDSIAIRFNSGTGSLGKLATDPTLFDNLNASLRSLDSLLKDLREHPERYVSFSVF